jgi:VIT1/CCC1 family predicted Fe2+/Mn2+ transporter
MMQSALTPAAAPTRAPQRKGANIALWVLQALLALAFVGAASGKLLGKPEMVALFEAVGVLLVLAGVVAWARRGEVTS